MVRERTMMVAPPIPNRMVAPYILSLDQLKCEDVSSEASFTQNQILEHVYKE